MRCAALAVPALALLTGCAGLDPAAAYREAARGLRFSLEAVHPRLDLALPLERSALVLAVDLGVENPSKIRLAARALAGTIHLDAAEGAFPLGLLQFPAGVDLGPASRRTVRAELRLPYAELRRAWTSLEAVALRKAAGRWRLEGRATLEVLGMPFEVPLKAAVDSERR